MANQLLDLWHKLSGAPGGKWLFSKIMGWKVPYTGSVRPRVMELAPGHAKARLHDRRGVRNHLRSIHALAQMNIAEFVTGLAMTAQLPKDARAIITGLSIEYTKKARGTLTASCQCPELGAITDDRELIIESQLHDEAGDLVSRAKATWRIGPRR
ncbi:DUF4442 domain-containing protein [Sulfidibacter corallicola]|uniref:DUF4442 domain-containing protein n=1 Tax=Sulfidibacter corallicola TaxID=2818388 RepID=A0A8A4TXP5_SULCO|nr:hotdog fold domain-containing protein [Sulfidibacter corallicola]QTD54270.1 DUF4442 domain-containing protein [Sulfidibacter corallicola]